MKKASDVTRKDKPMSTNSPLPTTNVRREEASSSLPSPAPLRKTHNGNATTLLRHT